jgi:DNA-binding PadR family transcriptional regulator
VRKGIDVSESTLYPVLRRLQKDDVSVWKVKDEIFE